MPGDGRCQGAREEGRAKGGLAWRCSWGMGKVPAGPWLPSTRVVPAGGLSCEPQTPTHSEPPAPVPGACWGDGGDSSQQPHGLSQQRRAVHPLGVRRKSAPLPESPCSPTPSLPVTSPPSSSSSSLSTPRHLPGARASRMGWSLNCFSLLRDINWR